MASNKKQSFVSGALILTLTGIIVKIIGYLYRVPLQNMLGGDGMGFYNTANALYAAVYSLAVMGFPGVIAMLVARYMEQGRYKDVKKVHRVSSITFAIIGAAGSVLVYALAKPYVNFAGNTPALACVLLVAPSVFFGGLLAPQRGFNQGLRNMTPTAISQVVEVLVKLCAGVVGAYWVKAALTAEYADSGTVMGNAMAGPDEARISILSLAAAGAICGVTLSILAGYVYFVVRGRFVEAPYTPEEYEAAPEPEDSKVYIKFIFGMGIPIALNSMVPSIANLIDSTTIIKRLANIMETAPEQLLASFGGLLDGKPYGEVANYLYGCYTGISVTLFNLLPAITGAISISALPHIAAMWQKQDMERMHKLQRSGVRLTAFIAAPIGFGLCALAYPISLMLFSESQLDVAVSAGLTSVMGIAAIFASILSPLFTSLNAIGRVDIPLKLTAASALLKIVYNYVMISIPSLNIRATPYGSLGCYVLLVAAAFLALYRQTGLKPQLWQTLGKTLVAGALCAVTAYGVWMLLKSSVGNTLCTLIAICAGALVYLAAIVVLKAVTREDVESLPKGEKIAIVLEKIGAIK